jgi:hypothetical protein
MAPPLIVAVFSANDAVVVVAVVSAIATIVGPTVVLIVKSLIRIREAAESAARNTTTTNGSGGPPTPFDTLSGQNEYIIGQVHAAQAEARAAAREARDAREATRINERKADVIRRVLEQGFAGAKSERAVLRRSLDANIAALERTQANGRDFGRLVVTGTIPILARLDAIDGGHSAEELRGRLIAAGVLSPDDEPEAAADAILAADDATPPGGQRATPPDGVDG